MTATTLARKPPPDAAARERIETELDANLLVEAGAGSGKTTSMVRRMVALVRTRRARVEEIAAVTFTRKAAAELRERFQEELERQLAMARAAGDAAAAAVLDAGLREIDRGFVGTIHSFCARILREHPVEAGLDPGFREVSGGDEARLRREAWSRFLERLAVDGDPALDELAGVGLRPAQLQGLFEKLSDNPDVEFPAEPVERPAPGAVRPALERLLDRAEALMPREEPPGGWDGLQSRIRFLRFSRRVLGWDSDVAFFDALADLLASAPKVTLNRWSDDAAGKKEAKALGQAFAEFGAEDGPARRLLDRWLAHRYPIALGFARRAAAAYEAERLRAGRLTFQDLLMRTAALLRESVPARRALAQRYRCLLVDEFQDTDPVQAEILFLLAAADPAERDWRRAEPRPGALFVVGDPKQSIYRFRRADVAIYDQVRRRFEATRGVLRLTANFRSRKAIEALVNEVFRERFPAEPTEQQAAFAELRVMTDKGGAAVCYEVVPAGSTAKPAVAELDAAMVAAWIRERIDEDEKRPGDFLVLTHAKEHLHRYARALEAHGVPVQVTGAGVGVEEELNELILLLEALADPDDATKTLAVLGGLFFGLDPAGLVDHVEAGGTLCFLDEPPGVGDAAVPRALATLRRWWARARREPAEVAIAAVVDELGLLPYAAAGELGGARAGALLFALDAARKAGLEGDTSVAAALDALRAAVAEAEADAPLEPGRRDVARVMNLHKAKGLEAAIVVLAYPTGDSDHEPTCHIRRPGDGGAVGCLQVLDGKTCMARPLDWPRWAEEEARFAAAEDDRLLYVAATRAKHELVVARCPATEKKSPWRGLYAALEATGEPPLELPLRPPPPRAEPERVAAEIAAEIRAVAAERRQRARPGYARAAISRLAKAGLEGSARAEPGEAAGAAVGRGPSWGSAVHAALEAAARGASGPRLRAVCRGLLLEWERPADAAGEPLELDELVGLVEAMRRSALWRRLAGADVALVEVPFALPVAVAGLDDAPGPALVDPLDPVFAAASLDPTVPLTILEGVIDLVFREPAGWVIVDYKTDAVGGPALEERRAAYRRQVDLYAWCWERLTGQSVVERALVFTSLGTEESWTAPATAPG